MLKSVLRKTIVLLVLAVLAGCENAGDPEEDSDAVPKDKGSIYNFVMNDIDGNQVSLSNYRGKVLMIVNVASKCGYTPQYKQLQSIYQKYRDSGFVVLGFPANNFGNQEPGSNDEIKNFSTTEYHVAFPMFSKISVTGEDIHPLYKFLTEKQTNPDFAGEITWNFNKFLVRRDGEISARFATNVEPDNPDVLEAIERAIGQD